MKDEQPSRSHASGEQTRNAEVESESAYRSALTAIGKARYLDCVSLDEDNRVLVFKSGVEEDSSALQLAADLKWLVKEIQSSEDPLIVKLRRRFTAVGFRS